MGERGEKGRKGREEGKRRGQRQGRAGRATGKYIKHRHVERTRQNGCSRKSSSQRQEKRERRKDKIALSGNVLN